MRRATFLLLAILGCDSSTASVVGPAGPAVDAGASALRDDGFVAPAFDVAPLDVPPLDVRYQMYAGSHEVLPTSVELLLTTIALKRGETPATRFIDVKERDGVVSLVPRTSEWVPLSVTLRR